MNQEQRKQFQAEFEWLEDRIGKTADPAHLTYLKLIQKSISEKLAADDYHGLAAGESGNGRER